jgi:hypothetical protein
VQGPVAAPLRDLDGPMADMWIGVSKGPPLRPSCRCCAEHEARIWTRTPLASYGAAGTPVPARVTGLISLSYKRSINQ